MTHQLAIIKQENIQTIVSAAPQAYSDNALSREKCINAGQAILDAIQQQGMNDQLDQQAAVYIEKARKTVKKMNERRSPATKLFDDIRKEFTAMENAIDPAKADTIPFKLQQLRNQFAAKKRQEEDERLRKEIIKQQAEYSRKKMRQDIEDNLRQQFRLIVNHACNKLSEIDNAISLENYDQSLALINDFSSEMTDDMFNAIHASIRIPVGINIDEVKNTEMDIKQRLSKQFYEQYQFEVDGTKQYILDRMPSKKANLQRIAEADEAEAERIKAEMEARLRKDAELKEADLRRKDDEQHHKSEMARQQLEINNLFNQQSNANSGYQPNVKVAQKINLLNPEGIMPILSMWWSKEGCHLSVGELTKMFRKQITFCEKLAKEGTFISDESVEYVEDIKAK